MPAGIRPDPAYRPPPPGQGTITAGLRALPPDAGVSRPRPMKPTPTRGISPDRYPRRPNAPTGIRPDRTKPEDE